MILYFADRSGKVLTSVSNNIPGVKYIESDTISDDLASSIKTIDVQLDLEDSVVRDAAVVGNLIMQQGTTGEYELYTINEIEHNLKDTKLTVYGEDAGIDFINKQVTAYKPSANTNITLDTAIRANIVYDSASNLYDGWNVVYNPDTLAQQTKKGSELTFDSDDNVTNRLKAILDIFKYEFYFSYEIDGLNIIKRTINIVEKRGSTTPTHAFVYGKDLSNITVKKDINNLATGFVVKNMNGSLISTMSGYGTYGSKTEPGKSFDRDSTTFTTERTHTYQICGNEVRCVEAMEKWKSVLDSDGKIFKMYSSEHADIKNTLEDSIRELEKVCEPTVSYSLSFDYIPEAPINVGDQIQIISEDKEIYIQARVQSWKRSETSQTFECEIADYKTIKGSKAATDFTVLDTDNYILSVTSDNGLIGKDIINTTLILTIFNNGKIITQKSALPDDLNILWYEKYADDVAETLIDPSDSRLSHEGFRLNITGLTEGCSFRPSLGRGEDDA